MEMPLRFKTLWIFVGWCLVIAVIILSLGPPPPPLVPTIDYGDKLGHVLAYFVLMGWFAQIYHKPRERLFYLIGFLLLGGGLEILQALGGTREGEWLDMLANSIGVLLAWFVTKTRLGYVLAYLEPKKNM